MKSQKSCSFMFQNVFFWTPQQLIILIIFTFLSVTVIRYLVLNFNKSLIYDFIFIFQAAADNIQEFTKWVWDGIPSLNFPNARNKEFFLVNLLYQKLHSNDQVWLFHQQSEVSCLCNSVRALRQSGTVSPLVMIAMFLAKVDFCS